MGTEESATHTDAHTNERESNDEHQKQGSTHPNQQMWTPQSSNTQRHGKIGKAKRRGGLTVAKQNHDKIAPTLSATLSTMRQESNARFATKETRTQLKQCRQETTHLKTARAHHPQEAAKELSRIQSVLLPQVSPNHPRKKK